MAIQADRPQGAQQPAYLPAGPEPLVFEMFQGVETQTTRPGVKDEKAFWIDGFFPLAPRNLRTLPDVGAPIYTAAVGLHVVFFGFANIGVNPVCVVFLSDGSVVQVNTNTLVTTQIAPPGTILNPSRRTAGLSQWGSQYIIIVSQQSNGYWLWDGTLLYGAGSLAPNVTITNNGSGYVSQPTIAASGGSGSGATFTATLTNGLITAITIVNPGAGYKVGETVTLAITGGGGASAAATVTLMPFGLSGNWVETYAGHVWVFNNASFTFSAPGSVSDFATSSGGGGITSNDSYLRVGYTSAIATNGFLFLIGDSSVDYISGVTTSGTPPTTTFNKQNADPKVGTPWGASVTTWGRNPILANPFGVHVAYGGSLTKVSEDLDGVYDTVPNFNGLYPSSANATIYAKPVFILLLPIVDPVSGDTVNKLLMWNGKIWWASEQSIDLIYIQHQEINSVITAYGTDGSAIYPLFVTPSMNFSKTVRSKFWTTPGGYQFIKTATRLWGLFEFDKAGSVSFDVDVESEFGSSVQSYASGSRTINVVNASGTIIPTVNGSAVTIPVVSFFGDGTFVLPPAAVGQQGVMTGLTLSTDEADFTLISLMVQDEIADYRG